jgi:hypothetical protein
MTERPPTIVLGLKKALIINAAVMSTRNKSTHKIRSNVDPNRKTTGPSARGIEEAIETAEKQGHLETVGVDAPKYSTIRRVVKSLCDGDIKRDEVDNMLSDDIQDALREPLKDVKIFVNPADRPKIEDFMQGKYSE